MNTEFTYMYRDAWNYKKTTSLILRGEINKKMIEKIKNTLSDEIFFIPSQVGLPEERSGNTLNFEADHPWFEFLSATPVTESPNFNDSIENLVKKFEKINGDWDETKWLDIELQ